MSTPLAQAPARSAGPGAPQADGVGHHASAGYIAGAMPHPVLLAAVRAKRAVLARDAAIMKRLVDVYGALYLRLKAQAQLIAEGIALGKDSAWAQERASALREQVEREIARYAVWLDMETQAAARDEIARGLADARRLTEVAYAPVGPAVVGSLWHALPTDAVVAMVGMLGEDSPLYAHLTGTLGEAVGEAVGRGMLEAIALGYGPEKLLARLRQDLGKGLTWSLTATRTAQIWAYREANRAAFVANADILDGWVWQATLDSRTCLSCVAQHGKVHHLHEVLQDHHAGRCTMLPLPKRPADIGLPSSLVLPDLRSQIETGEEWFAGLPPSHQQALMGPSRYAAYQAGAFRFEDLSKGYADPIYGDMLREASLKDLLGEGAKAYYGNQTVR